jgi:hypothetical protein
MKPNEPSTFFPELDGDEREQAERWLKEYLRLVTRIHREHLDRQLSTGAPLTDAGVLERSVRPLDRPTNHDEEVLRIHKGVNPTTGTQGSVAAGTAGSDFCVRDSEQPSDRGVV